MVHKTNWCGFRSSIGGACSTIFWKVDPTNNEENNTVVTKTSVKKRKVTRKKPVRRSVNFWAKLARQEPNNAELQLFGLITYLELPYRYTGNAQFILNGKAPDFVHYSKRKIIELFGERWHKPEEEEERITEFAASGYQVLVIWLKELRIKNRKKVSDKIRFFESLPEIEWDRFT